ncbi:MAG TPA: glycine oxidase ThiO [Candidatus Nitrosotalea sp.]|nr:glycine oxidase ThiO [Candidatus Nitrosotalea sp.]
MARILIVGGGVIGCAIAERLSRAGHRVTLLERDHLGAHASGAAAGLLAPHSEGGQELELRSLGLFPELVERIEALSGVEVEYRAGQTIAPALSGEEERRLRRGSGRWLDAGEALALEPALNPAIRGVALYEEAQVSPPRFVRALARAAQVQGAEIKEGVPVGALVGRSNRVSGVRTSEGDLRADFTVLAAGPWSPALASPLGVALDVRPSRGQLLTLLPPRRLLTRLLTWGGSYLMPKPDGTLIAGSTEEEVGFDARVTASGMSALLEFATRAVPALSTAVLDRSWAALRPATPDGRPLIGLGAGREGLIVATGHNRNGVLLAPVTAEMVLDLITANA